ncbi:MAG: deoxyguanosinetriphosphate triphosphohydrolase [Nitrospirales bacterium]|nr:deoxyguanosinetriphosphate triphosphohydrolase [Nitrospirales bacterium]
MSNSIMRWEKLLSKKRQGRNKREDSDTVGRSVFQRDYDRIVYFPAFRRLQDKAQVFPLAKSDFVRTRLTHSLEVSCVGRSLGTEVGAKLGNKLPAGVEPTDIGSIVAAACLAHDIGNPPFGHSGEAAIGEWFRFNENGQKIIKDWDLGSKADFERFEGNAQGFRILTKLQNPHNPGLQLTCATLATFTKYPRESCIEGEIFAGDCWEKYGFFQAEKPIFEDVANEVGLLRKSEKYSVWSRHPLAYLMEAADDICYRVNDLEDGFRLGYIKFEEAQNLLLSLLQSSKDSKKLDQISHCHDKIGYLRAKAINALIGQTVDLFIKEEGRILRGELNDSLIKYIQSAANLKIISNISKDKIFKAREVLDIEIPGFRVFAGLLKAFLLAVNNVEEYREDAKTKSKLILALVPEQFLGEKNTPDREPYLRTLKITDYISGMTDSFAVSLYKKIMGISLPTS